MTLLEKVLSFLTAVIGLLVVLPQLIALLGKTSPKSLPKHRSEIDAVQKSNLQDGDKAKVISTLQVQVDALKEHRGAIVRLAWSTLVASLSVGLVLVLIFFTFQDDSRLFEILARNDPQAFEPLVNVEVARVYPDRVTLDAASNIRETIAGTTKSFDVVAFTAYYFFHSLRDDLLALLKKPVHVRFILIDEESNDFARTSSALGHSGEQTEMTFPRIGGHLRKQVYPAEGVRDVREETKEFYDRAKG